MRAILVAIGLLCLSNVFMTFAWYAHLKELLHKPWFLAVLVSWGIAFFEYLLQVPANRIGFTVLNVAAAEDPAGSDHAVGIHTVRHFLHEAAPEARLSVGRFCILGAVYFVFRDKLAGG